MTPVDSETRAPQCPPRHVCPECCEVCRVRRRRAVDRMIDDYHQSQREQREQREADYRFWREAFRWSVATLAGALTLWALGRLAAWVGGAL